MVRALGLFNDNSGCDYHRIKLPFQYGGDFIDNSGFTSGDPEKTFKAARLLAWNRIFPIHGTSPSSLREISGCKLVVDIDDSWNLYANHYLSNDWKKQGVPAIIEATIRMADAVTVTTHRLADKVKPINANVHVIPNALPYGHGQFGDNSDRHDGIYRFIYPCQRSHLYDARILKGPLQRFSSDNNRTAGITLAGFNPEDKSGIWAEINRIMSAGYRMTNYKTINQLPLESYMQIYDGADAVLIPLEDNTFNHHKSNLKILEAATHRLPVICSKVPPYSDCEAPVLWVERQSDWYNHMKYLLKNPAAGVEIGERLFEWANTNHNLFAWNRYRFDLYEHIVNS